MANEAYRPMTAQDLIKMYGLDSLIADRKQTKAAVEKIKVLEDVSNSLKNFAEEVEKQIEELEKIADGKITTYYYSGVPTLSNFPASEWTVEEYENHIGDMYYDKETGDAYKFLYDNETNEYLWRKEMNAELSEALAKANAAQDTADRKRQIFVEQPYPPYQVGDLWLKDDKVIYRCRAEKTEGEYSGNDWKLATDFTNDDYAKNVEQEFNKFKVEVESDYATKVLLETTKDEIKTSVEALTTKTETLEDELGNKVEVSKVTELTQRVDEVQTATSSNITAIERLEQNDEIQSEKIAEFEITVDEVSTTISNQENKISKVTQTVEELNSKISDVADITISAEDNDGQVELDNINQSEPIRVVVRPIEENIFYLYPRDNLYPSDTLYPKDRIIRFNNLTTHEIFDYELPTDLLYYDNENYDEFLLDYDGQSCVVNKRVGYNDDGTTYVLDVPKTLEFEYPRILLTDGDYQVNLPSYNNAYLFVRLMAQNIYTTQFSTRAEVTSEINQTAQSISLEVSQKVGKNEVVSSINNAINKEGQGVIELKSNSVIIDSDNFKLSVDGTINAKNGKFSGNIESTDGTIGGWELDESGLSNGEYYIKKNGYSNVYVISDIYICQLIILGTIPTPDSNGELFKHYDINNDGVIDIKDMLSIQNKVLGKN